MGSCHVIGALLLLLVASSGSQTLSENTKVNTDDLPLHTTEPLTFSTLEVESQSSTQPLLAKHLEVETSASSAATGVTSAKEEASTSHEPTTDSTGLIMTLTLPIRKDVGVTSEPSTTAWPTRIHDPSTTRKTADVPIIPAREDIDPSKTPEVDQNATDPSTTTHRTDGRDDTAYVPPDVPDKKNGGNDNKPTDNDHGKETTTDKTAEEKEKKERLEREKKSKLVKRILIGVFVVILLMLLVTMVIFLLRKKRRSGSFRTQSRKGAKQDVWAGQVPQLGEGKGAQDPVVVENGTARAGLEPVEEEEMVTFVTGEKKMDSTVEVNELGSGEKPEANGGEKVAKDNADEEKTPLIEEAPEKSPEPKEPAENFPLPPAEQELMPIKV